MLMMVTLVLLLTSLFGCADVKHQIAFKEHYKPPADIKIQVGEVFNDTGFESDVNMEELLTDALEEELDAEGLLWMGKEGPKLILVSRIVDYKKGSAAKRWVTPGWGSTILSVECDVQEQNGNIVGIVKAKGEVSSGGLYSADAWRYIFNSVADDIAKDLKRGIEGKSYVYTSHSERTDGTFKEVKKEPLVLSSNKPWAGKWQVESSDGVTIWDLIQEGSQVRSVQGSARKLKAKVKEDRLLGMLESSAGDVVTLDLKVSEDGQSFKGEGDSFGKTIIYQAKKIDPISKPDTVTKKTPETFNPNEPWTGMWKVDSTHHYDPSFWEIKQSGNTIKFNNIKGKAEVKGTYLKGWYEGTLSGHRRSFSIKIADDGLTFKGKADMGIATIQLKGTRLGNLTEPVPVIKVDPNEPWTGTWKVTGFVDGDRAWEIKQNGSKVICTRDSPDKIRGKVKGYWLKGFSRNNTFKLKLSHDLKSFEGKAVHRISSYGGTQHLKGERQE
jgi:hypothetical protein